MNFYTTSILALVCFYVLLVVVLFFFQGNLLYHPSINNYLKDQEAKEPTGIEKVRITTKDKIDLMGWFYNKNVENPKIILFFHGNAGSLENRTYKLNHFKDLNLNFLIVAWRGFNGNSGKPSEKGLYDDARSAVRWLKSIGIKEENIILYGESLGAAVAIEISQNKNFAGIILESAFTSMVEMGKKYYPFFPVSFLLKDKYKSINKIKNIHFPVLVMHGKRDKVVPFEMGKKIFYSANLPKFSYFSDYDDHMMEYNELLIKKLELFIGSLN